MMSWIIHIAIAACLVCITIQDFRFRAVHWWLFPLVFGFGIISSLQIQSMDTILFNSVFNLLYLLITGGVVCLYFMLKERKVRPGLQHRIGMGDILFVLALIPFFDLLSYIGFIVLSSVAALALHALIRQKDFYGDPVRIPFAGIQSITLLGFTGAGLFRFNTYSFLGSHAA